MGIDGEWFDARESRSQRAVMHFYANGTASVELPDHRRLAGAVAELTVSARLGRIPRRVTFPDGSVFETDDNDGIDGGLRIAGIEGKRPEGWIDSLESRWQVALCSIAAVVVTGFAFVKLGLPALADFAAFRTPMTVERAMGREGLSALDRLMFEPSALPSARQAQLRDRFEAMTQELYSRDVEDSPDYRLEFRSSGAVGANALALPSGIIVLTDDLVKLARHDDEIMAVIAHEVGHVERRHGLRSLYRSAGIAALAAAVLGDVSQVAGLAAFLPQFVEAGYSRDFEREADAYAKAWLRTKGIPERRFDDLLCRMIAEHGGDDDGGVLRYLASHPSGKERAGCGPDRTAR
jgi:Zn-dependent protease with chaperone function